MHIKQQYQYKYFKILNKSKSLNAIVVQCTFFSTCFSQHSFVVYMVFLLLDKCITGNPAKITWSREGAGLPATAVSTDDYLLISEAGLQDAGSYICKISNQTELGVVQLRVVEKGSLQKYFSYTCIKNLLFWNQYITILFYIKIDCRLLIRFVCT